MTRDNARFITLLQRLNHRDVAAAGGKGANLGELIQAGFPVPPGFVVTTAAYDAFVARNGLGQVIFEALGDATGGAIIRNAFEASPIPAEIESAVVTAYRQLGAGLVAIRSSATAEDLPQAAFAGQQDTYLNIQGEAAILNAVRRCWASLWTDRAIAYRERQRVDQNTVRLAVVVQRMVAADVAGVMFTANPVTGERGEVVIDANPGLGEAIVSGLVTPDHFMLDKRTGKIKERSLGRREVVVWALPGGGTEHAQGSSLIGSPTLTDQTLTEMAYMGAAIERHFGRPQDIEWTWAEGKLSIVQARPMTALPEAPQRVSRPAQLMAATLSEVFAVRPYPLDEDAWLRVVFADVLGPMFAVVGIKLPPREVLFHQQDGVIEQMNANATPRLTPAVLLAPVRLLALAWRYDPGRADSDPQLAEARARASALESRDFKSLSWAELLATVHEALALAFPLAGQPRRRYFPRAMLATGLLAGMLKLVKHSDRLLTLLSGVDSATLRANHALEDLAARVRGDAVLSDVFAHTEPKQLLAALNALPEGRSFLADLDVFMGHYGHRDVTISTVLQPTWKDAPEQVLAIVKGFAQSERRRENGRAAWEMARDEVLAQPALRFPPLRAAFLACLKTARYVWQVRENTHFDLTRVLPPLRRALLEMGRRLVEAGAIATPEAVFHLRLGELERAGATWPIPAKGGEELRAIVRRRSQRRVELNGKPLVDPRLFRQTQPDGDALLRGTPGSPGSVEGPVRIIHDSAEFDRLREGEVLVAAFTNPSWTPLFQRACAVVVDGGSAGSHAAIVAREYGIPAVMGVVDGTQRLADGQRVRVDGTRGLVFPA